MMMIRIVTMLIGAPLVVDEARPFFPQSAAGQTQNELEAPTGIEPV
jgi:hypothetical protein